MAAEPPSQDDDKRKPKAIGPPIFASGDLLGGYREVIIQHGQEQYRLRLTTNNKLILVK